MKFRAIRENHLYQKAYHKGTRFVGQTVAVFVLRDYLARRLQNADPRKIARNRIGISVSKKNGGAVERNRAKRVIRAALQAVERDCTVKTGFLVVISARTGIAGVSSRDVERELRAAFDKLGLCPPAAPQKPV